MHVVVALKTFFFQYHILKLVRGDEAHCKNTGAGRCGGTTTEEVRHDTHADHKVRKNSQSAREVMLEVL